jgi:hypothetical protein
MGQFVESLTAGMSRPQRARFAEYALALLLPGDRKSMGPWPRGLTPSTRWRAIRRFSGSSACPSGMTTRFAARRSGGHSRSCSAAKRR